MVAFPLPVQLEIGPERQEDSMGKWKRREESEGKQTSQVLVSIPATSLVIATTNDLTLVIGKQHRIPTKVFDI